MAYNDSLEQFANSLLDLGEKVAEKLARPRSAAETLEILMTDPKQRNVAVGVLLALSHPEWASSLYRAWLAESTDIHALEQRTIDFYVRSFPIEEAGE